MAAFSYRALDAQGRSVKGVQEGDSARQVRAQLRGRGLQPLSVERVAGGRREQRGQGGWWQLLRPLKAADLALMTRQLATLLQSGLPLDEALQACAEQNRSARLKSLVLAVRSRVLEGHSLAQALGEYPRAFDPLYRAMVRAGEHAGLLGVVLERLADYTEQRQFAQQRLRTAMLYPTILLSVAVGVVALLMSVVVPKLVGIFAHSQAQLPTLTRWLIALSDFTRDYGLWLVTALLLLAVLARRWVQASPRRIERWHALLLTLPWFGRVLRVADSARFAATLSSLTRSGVPLLEALKIASEVMSNQVLQGAAQRVAQQVQEGGSLWRALEQSERFPPMLIHMVAAGERSGELDNMLERAAANQERELDNTLATVMAVMEPLMVVIMGTVVMGIVLAILLPIFDLNNLVR